MLRNSLFLCTIVFLFGQGLSYDGYIKSMPYYSDAASILNFNDDFELNMTFNARLNLLYDVTDNLSLHIENKIYGVMGESNNGYLYQLIPQTQQDYFDLNTNIDQTRHNYYEHRIDRIYLNLWLDDLEITIGRQRISWGKNFIWNPTDVFHTTDPTDFDNEEKNGADAFYTKYYLSELTNLEYAIKFIALNESRTQAIKINSNFFEYDISVLAGLRTEKILKDFSFLGLSWSGEIYGGGFRGEVLAYKQDRSKMTSVGLNVFGDEVKEVSYLEESGIITAFSVDYTFENSFYTHTEFMTNTAAYESYMLYYNSPFKFILSDKKDLSLFQEFSYQFHPLVRGGYFGIYDFEQQTLINYLNLNYSYSETIDLSLFALIGEQKFITKINQHAYYMRLKWYF